MGEITRREMIEAGMAAGLGTMWLGGTDAFADDKPRETAAAPPRHSAKPLPFKAGRLKGLSEKLIQSHWENNYSGAVKALNDVEAKLAELAKDKNLAPSLFNGYKREQLVRLGSVILHERYFGNLGGEGKAAGDLKGAIETAFGGFDAWETEFRKTALGLGGGSGWVVLNFNLHMKRLENYWAWDHMHNAPAGLPILVLDMYEHAYQMDYGAQAAKYVDAFMHNVNWEEANRRYVAAAKAQAILS
jgi:Fe-Mn family superoxide dismutase